MSVPLRHNQPKRVFKKAELHREALEHLDESIEEQRQLGNEEKARKLEEFKANYVMYPFGPEGTTVSRKQWEKEKKCRC